MQSCTIWGSYGSVKVTGNIPYSTCKFLLAFYSKFVLSLHRI